MSNRPKLQILIGLNDLKFSGYKIVDPRYKPNSDLADQEMWEEMIPSLKSMQQYVQPKDYESLGYHEAFFGENPDRKTFSDHIEWAPENGNGSVIGVRVSLGVYATDEIYALASCFNDFATSGFKVLKDPNPLKSTTGANCEIVSYALLREFGLDIKMEDLKMMLYWSWGGDSLETLIVHADRLLFLFLNDVRIKFTI